MFIQRLLAALVLVPLILGAIFYANPWVLGCIVLIVYLIAGTESWQLLPVQRNLSKVGFILLLLCAAMICHYTFNYWMAAGLVSWVLIVLAIISFPVSMQYWGRDWVVGIALLIVLPLFVISLVRLYFMPQGKQLLVYLLFLIWAADSGAYIFGKLWGKNKLIPQVSPGKSWEGVFGGLFFSMLIAWLGFLYFPSMYATYWFGLSLLVVILSIFGDLFQSILKRRTHLKDTGSIIPGHGGILDRLDSLIVAVPLFYAGFAYNAWAFETLRGAS